MVEIEARALRHRGGRVTSEHGRSHLAGWGAPGDTLAATFSPAVSGRHLVSAVYGNGHGPVNTGITAGVKELAIVDAAGREVGRGTLIMPHRGDWAVWAESTPVAVELEAGERYELRVEDGINMSYFAHFARYGAAGGGPEPVNTVNLAALRIARY